MFRVTFTCEDNRLARALHALIGIAAQPPEVQPMSNAVVVRGKIKQRVPGTNLKTLILNHCNEQKIKKVTAHDLKFIVSRLGYNPASLNRVLWEMKQEKALTRLGRGVYNITQPKQ